MQGMSYLVRYGVVPEVARCQPLQEEAQVRRGASVVVETHRGLQMGYVLEAARESNRSNGPKTEAAVESPIESSGFRVVREATESDQRRHDELRSEAEQDFARWTARIREWKVDVQLIDLEWTLDRSKLVLYVLNERGPECTKLAIQAAAAGLGVVEVQPVSREGLVSQPSSGGGCGSGGCGCHN
jgi:cell fate regulator YaaT (PSP1 superfamily)